MDNVLPLVKRRQPIQLSSFTSQPAVRTILQYYDECLEEIFRYYADTSDLSTSRGHLLRATSNANKSRTFDEHKQKQEQAAASDNASRRSGGVHGADVLDYTGFLRFAADFGLSSSMGLTTLDLGEFYLTVIAQNQFVTQLRPIDYKEFQEVTQLDVF